MELADIDRRIALTKKAEPTPGVIASFGMATGNTSVAQHGLPMFGGGLDEYGEKVEKYNESLNKLYAARATAMKAMGTGKLSLGAYQKEQHKLLLESNTVWGAR